MVQDETQSAPTAELPALSTAPEEGAAPHADEAQSIAPTIKPVGPAWKQLKDGWGSFFGTLRHNAVSWAPRLVVNNSSNLLGFTHVLTEIMMFKASLKGGVLVEEKAKNPLDYAWKVVKRVGEDSISNSKFKDPHFGEMIKKYPLTGFFRYIADTKAATEFEVATQMKQGLSRAAVQLGNPWQTRSTLAGLVTWTASTLLPDRKESDEEIERMGILAATNKPRYVMERLKQAVWVPGWLDHKRQMIGLGIMASGIFSTLGAWRGHVRKDFGKVYEFNVGYFCTSLITFVASLPLLFASDDQRGFAGFGGIMMGRLAFLPSSISKKLKGGEKGAEWYLGATASFQAENVAQALIGGAEKLPDGNIIDHQAIRAEAHRKAEAIKHHRKMHDNDNAMNDNEAAVPSTKIVGAHLPEHAMPERVAAHAQGEQQQAVNA